MILCFFVLSFGTKLFGFCFSSVVTKDFLLIHQYVLILGALCAWRLNYRDNFNFNYMPIGS